MPKPTKSAKHTLPPEAQRTHLSTAPKLSAGGTISKQTRS